MIHTLESVQVVHSSAIIFSFSLTLLLLLLNVQVLNTVSSVGVGVGGGLVLPQAKEGSIQVHYTMKPSRFFSTRNTGIIRLHNICSY